MRAEERRQREDSASRLHGEVPQLESLRLEIEERSPIGAIGNVSHIRHIVVQNAPALFDLPCSDHDCRDGGHDVTFEIMRALRRGEEHFEGSDVCSGEVGNAACHRQLHYVATATYAHQAAHTH